MYLKQIEIYGFRGIKDLVLDLNRASSVFIGENRWGRSSFFGALTLLSLDQLFYQCKESDFYQDERGKNSKIDLRFIFEESFEDEFDLPHYQPLNAIHQKSQDSSLKRVEYQIRAVKQQQSVETWHRFLDRNARPIEVANNDGLIQLLIALNPVIKLKNPLHQQSFPNTNRPLSEYYTKQLSEQLIGYAQQFSEDELERGILAARILLEYYLGDKRRNSSDRKESLTPDNWGALDRINTFITHFDDTYAKTALMGIFISLLTAKGDHQLDENAVPILIMEEPESQMHPIILSICHRLLSNFPTQKIIATNSSDLISLYPLESIYHMIRTPTKMLALHVKENELSASDSRKILFHILYRRPSAIFARCWLLVEGETEIWLLRELADEIGFNLTAEGVQLIEFSQCGLSPLIRYAKKMGIQWHVLTDGDPAGKKYANTAASLCSKGDAIKDHLTVLPAPDMEHFLFKNGFANVYKIAAYGTTSFNSRPIRQIIHRAIERTSKPDLAIAICDEVKRRGIDAVPSRLKTLFNALSKFSRQLSWVD